MNLESKPTYKKIDGIYSEEEKFTKWQKFCIGFGKFIGKGLAGKWEIKFTWKF
jgi:hypothetical protein